MPSFLFSKCGLCNLHILLLPRWPRGGVLDSRHGPSWRRLGHAVEEELNGSFVLWMYSWMLKRNLDWLEKKGHLRQLPCIQKAVVGWAFHQALSTGSWSRHVRTQNNMLILLLRR